LLSEETYYSGRAKPRIFASQLLDQQGNKFGACSSDHTVG